MPIYEYECTDCKNRFEIIHGADKTPDDLKCPKCGAGRPKKMISCFCSAPKAMSTGRGSSCGSGKSRGFS